ncbi:hypothetical protein HR059_07440 [Sinorhizobium meliloti WSM1022]|uniref:hypothetical protein n=1 Tax=Rhizobium meliloti TaxID=382 RepID=UPI0004862DE8|nr:hypothetical protein [Sinorhizobium meliloti]QKN14305.1 hypothetical protein HR059_07440 [Sinorhizobium meliloti WSM1022]
MARKILSAEIDSTLADSIAAYGHSPLKLDAQVEIDWKFRIGVDPNDGNWISEHPPYDVKLLGGLKIGTLTDPEEIKWVRKATDDDPDAGAVGRINEIIHSENPRVITGLKLEVLTGVHAKALKSQNEFEAAKQGFLKYWWIIPVLLLLIWWKS